MDPVIGLLLFGLLGLAVGAYATLIGAGGGFIIVPMLFDTLAAQKGCGHIALCICGGKSSP